MNIKSGAIENFEQHSQFSSLTEFNHHIEMWLSMHKYDFTKGELVGFKRLVRFAAKIPGVCNAKIGTVTKAIYEDYNGNGISRSTFKRMVQKAISLGILTVYETERKNGSQSSNLYVFNRFMQSELPNDRKTNPHKTNNLSKTNIKNHNKRKEDVAKRNLAPVEFIKKEINHNLAATDKPQQQELKHNVAVPTDSHSQEPNFSPASVKTRQQEFDHTFTSERVPGTFVALVKCFFPEAKTIEEYWKMTTIAAYRNNRETEADTVLQLALRSFKQMINKAKNGRVRNLFAYYYGILSNKLEELYFEELFEMGFE